MSNKFAEALEALKRVDISPIDFIAAYKHSRQAYTETVIFEKANNQWTPGIILGDQCLKLTGDGSTWCVLPRLRGAATASQLPLIRTHKDDLGIGSIVYSCSMIPNGFGDYERYFIKVDTNTFVAWSDMGGIKLYIELGAFIWKVIFDG